MNTENTFNVHDFCEKTNYSSYNHDFTAPWKKYGKVYATDKSILFVGNPSDYPDIQEKLDSKPDISKLGIEKRTNFMPITSEEIEEILNSHPPLVEKIYEIEKCFKCKGSGDIEEECDECGQLYKKTCDKCQGEGILKGEIKTNNIISEKIALSEAPFKEVLINWKYLQLIKNSMQALGGKWQVSVTKPHEMVVFKNEIATIAVMPIWGR